MRVTIAKMTTSYERDSAEALGLIDELVGGVLVSVDADMRGQPASMVYEILDATLQRRLPGVQVDEEAMRDAAAKISVGALIG